MSSTEDLQKLKTQIEKQKTRVSEAEGVMKNLIEKLRQMGFSPASAQKEIARLSTTIAKMNGKLDSDIAELGRAIDELERAI